MSFANISIVIFLKYNFVLRGKSFADASTPGRSIVEYSITLVGQLEKGTHLSKRDLLGPTRG